MSETAAPYPPKPITSDALARAVERHGEWLEEGRKLGIITERRRYADLDGEHVSGEAAQAWMSSELRLWVDGLHLAGDGRVELGDAVLDGARLRGARLPGASFFQAKLGRAWLGHADLEGAHLGHADLRRAALQSARLKAAYLSGAQLRGSVLRKADLQDADLSGADLREADLTGANLTRADLRDADLGGANLEGATMGAARLRGTSLREADLRHVDLREVTGLQADQLAGAQISGARLPPDLHEFDAPLKHVEEASSSAQKLFVTVLLACLYSLLTIATTTDARLLTNSASSPLPILGTEVPIVSFHIVAPALLLALYLYLHLYLQRLWEGLAALPAVFPDGRALDRKAYPWLLGGLVRAHVRLLRDQRPVLSRLQTGAAIVSAWWVVPATLLAFWGRSLPRHDWTLTGIHLGLLGAAVGAAVAFQRLMRRTLRRQGALETAPQRLPDRLAGAAAPAGALAAVLIVASSISWGAIEGADGTAAGSAESIAGLSAPARHDLRRLVPGLLGAVRYRTFLNLEGEDVSVKPAGWTASGDGQLAAVRAASLTGRDLRRVRARRAFLVHADLAGADLRGADLREADLRGANLGETNWSYFWRDRSFALMPLGDDHRRTDLRIARLMRADLRAAILQGADLRGADLRLAALQEAVLVGADLRGADLNLADLRNALLKAANLEAATLVQADLRHADVRDVDFAAANLTGANLFCAVLRGARLRSAIGLTAETVRAARFDQTTTLPPDLGITPGEGQTDQSCGASR